MTHGAFKGPFNEAQSETEMIRFTAASSGCTLRQNSTRPSFLTETGKKLICFAGIYNSMKGLSILRSSSQP